MSDFPENIAGRQIPVDKNFHKVSVLSALDKATDKIVPIDVIDMGDGSYALKTTSVGTFSPPTTDDAEAITPVAVSDVASLALAANAARKGHMLYNAGNATVYLGATSAVTVATGIPVGAGASFDLDPRSATYVGDIYVIADTGETSEIRGINYL